MADPDVPDDICNLDSGVGVPIPMFPDPKTVIRFVPEENDADAKVFIRRFPPSLNIAMAWEAVLLVNIKRDERD
jgi:hypothetical protein